MGLVICDLNGLKLVNDTLGHSMGDTIIKESSRIVKSALSTYEEACRIGGDEFAIFFFLTAIAHFWKKNTRTPSLMV